MKNRKIILAAAAVIIAAALYFALNRTEVNFRIVPEKSTAEAPVTIIAASDIH